MLSKLDPTRIISIEASVSVFEMPLHQGGP